MWHRTHGRGDTQTLRDLAGRVAISDQRQHFRLPPGGRARGGGAVALAGETRHEGLDIAHGTRTVQEHGVENGGGENRRAEPA